MTLTVNLTTEEEARLETLSRAAGKLPDEYVRGLIMGTVGAESAAPLAAVRSFPRPSV